MWTISNRFKVLSVLAVVLMALLAMVIVTDGSESDADAGTYTGGDNLSTADNPYSAIDFDSVFVYDDDGKPISVRSLPSGIYLLNGSNVSIPMYTYNGGFFYYGVTSVTSGFGLTVEGSSIAGKVTGTGTMTIGQEVHLQGQVATSDVTIYVVDEPEETIPVTSISLTVTAGPTATVTAKVTPTTATNTAVTWSLSNSIATHSDTSTTTGGTTRITPSGAGTVVVTATSVSDPTVSNTVTLYIGQAVFDAGEGSGGPGSMFYVKTSSVSQMITPSSAPTRSGYEFVGWSTTAGLTANYPSGTPVVLKMKTVTNYYASYGQYHDISFSSNVATGGTPPTIDPVLIEENSRGYATIPQNSTFTLYKTGYALVGWSTTPGKSSLSDGDYAPGASITINYGDDITLYPVWSLDVTTFTVTFDAQGGSPTPDPISTALSGSTATVGPIGSYAMTKTGCTFLGWSTTAGGSTQSDVDYVAGDSVTNVTESGVTLYAVWAVLVSGISITADTGFLVSESVLLDPTVVPSNASDATITWTFVSGSDIATMELLTGNQMRLHFNGAGYVEVRATANDGSAVYGSYGTNVYNGLNITYDVGDGTGEIEQFSGRTQSSSLTTTLSSTVPTAPSGLTFAGWATTDGGAAVYEAGKQYTFDLLTSGPTYVTLYAVYKEPTYKYTLRYHANGGTDTPADTVGETTGLFMYLTVTSEVPSYTGMVFLGWNTDGTSETAIYKAGDQIRVTSTTPVLLYAIWDIASLTISGTPSVTSLVTGSSWSFTPVLSNSDATVTVSGASWLSVVNGTVVGTPTTAGTYNITLTASKDGYSSDAMSFTITVVSKLSFDSVPVGGAIAYAA